VASRHFEKTGENLFVARIGDTFGSATEVDIQSWLSSFKTQYPDRKIACWRVTATYDSSVASNSITIILLLKIRIKMRTKRLRH